MRKTSAISWLLICTLLLVLHYNVFPQPVNPRFETLSVNEGLSQSSIYSIHQDKKGFMWFGTGDGLNRFDGESIKIFKARNTGIANSNIIRGRICEDDKGRIWYANETGIYHFNPVTERIDKSLDFSPLINGGFIYYFGVLIDQSQSLWLVDPIKGPVKFNISTGNLQLIPFPDDVSKTEFVNSVEPAEGFIFFHFSNRNGILRFEIATQTYDWVFTEFRNAKVKRGKKEIFLIREGGVHVIDSVSQNEHFISLPKRVDVRSVLRDMFGRIWISTNEKGLYCFLPESDKLISYVSSKSKLSSLPIDLTTSLFIDATNNLWIGTDGGGVARLDIKPLRFNIFPFDEGEYPYMKDFFTRCLYEDDGGRIWFGTLNNGFSILNPDNGQVKNFSKLTHDVMDQHRNSVTAIFRDDNGVIWVGHNNGVSIFDEQKNTFEEIQLDLPDFIDSSHNSFYHIIQSQGRDLLIATFGIIQISKTDANYKGIMKKGSSTMTFTFLKEVKKDHIWLTSPINGLIHFLSTDQGFVFVEKFFQGYDLRSFHVDESDPETLWVCSGSGLIKFNTSSHEFKVYNEEHGMSGSYIYGVLEDANHNLWMSSNTGLSFFNRSTETFQNFTFNDGLQSNEFNTGAFYKGASGTLYFGGIKGFNWFKTGAEKFEGTPPKIALTRILVNHQSILKDTTFSSHNSMSLHHTENDLAFEIAVLDYTRPKANRIQYKLEGWQNEWITTFTKNVYYSNLPPRRYTFRVRGSNGGELWGEEVSIPILIKAPIWKTNWFYAAMGIVLIGSIIGITRSIARRKLNLKLQQLEKQHAVMHERERIRKDIHDDLGSGLSKIAILSEVARQSGSQEEFSKRQLEKISESSRQLIDNLGELIWSNNPANDSLEKLFWYLREHLAGMFEDSTIRFSISLPEFIPEVEVQAEWRRNIFLIIKESLHNVLKHSKATEAVVSVKVIRGLLLVTIFDNGCGFDVEKRNGSGNGLGNISNRVKDCEGTLSLNSTPGKGTTVHVEVPVRKI